MMAINNKIRCAKYLPSGVFSFWIVLLFLAACKQVPTQNCPTPIIQTPTTSQLSAYPNPTPYSPIGPTKKQSPYPQPSVGGIGHLTSTPAASPSPIPTISLSSMVTYQPYNDQPFSAVCLRDGNLWLMEIGTGVERQLTYLPKDWNIHDFDISPLGDRVAYIPYINAAFKNALIRVVHLPSGRLGVITGLNDPAIEYGVRWLSEDQITYQLYPSYAQGFSKQGPNHNLPHEYLSNPHRSIIMNLNSNELGLFPDYAMVYQSPDKRFRLACDISNPPTCQYVLLDIGSSEQWPVAGNVNFGKFIGWSPDSQFMLFTSQLRFQSNPNQLLLIDTKSLLEITITDNLNRIMSASWSPDGEMIAYSFCNEYEEICEVWIVSKDGKVSQAIPSEYPLKAYELGWSPDGSRLIFKLGGFVEKDFWSIRIDGTDLRPILTNVHACRVVTTP
ncbi:hypothetical protein ACFLZW_00800 [Chloroflexota bacterium]